jgi:starch phosphorylase
MLVSFPSPPVAYFSMEIGVDAAMPTFSGGLGVLAGDTLRAAADLGVDMVGVTLLYRKGYFRQHLDADGNQAESPDVWSPSALERMDARVAVAVEGRSVHVAAWRYRVRGVDGHTVPVYFLDTDLDENDPAARSLTDSLYGGDVRHRLGQEVVLGLGGVAMLRALGHDDVTIFHMNEGHSAFLTLGLLREMLGEHDGGPIPAAILTAIRRRCVFTTHTPVPAGQDQFPIDLVRQVLGGPTADCLSASGCCLGSTLNMTAFALFFSHYVNGVAMRHGEISRGMYPNYPVNSITNGVHAATWVADPFAVLFDRHFPEWRRDNLYLRYAVGIPPGEILQAHAACKQALLAEVERRSGMRLDPAACTLGFARRATGYKRFDLLFRDLDRLRRIAETAGPLQVLFAGKAHPRDDGGKDQIRRVFDAARVLDGRPRVVYLEGYDMALAKVLCAGVDVWVNTPQRPQEASGTSGMKAAVNGVPSLSVLDGWWVEGCVDGMTGWPIGDDVDVTDDSTRDAASLYDRLERTVLPLVARNLDGYGRLMRSVIALNASFFNTQRMLAQYVRNAYRPAHVNPASPNEPGRL